MTKVWYMAQRHHLEMPYPHLNILKPKDEAAVRSTEDILIEQELEKLLQLIPIREDQISNLKKGTRLFLYGTGEYIIEVGKPAGKLYILKSGQVKMTFIGVTKIQERILYKGEYFGQISIKSDQPVSFSVQVTEDAEVLILDQPQVIEMIENNPKLAFYLGNGSHLNNPAGSKNGYAFLTN